MEEGAASGDPRIALLPGVLNVSSVVWGLADGAWALADVPTGWSHPMDRYPAQFDTFETKEEAVREQ